jgi:uncharacterized membrane protein YeaQ/YmgE (transglycosylase-associated protein family)
MRAAACSAEPVSAAALPESLGALERSLGPRACLFASVGNVSIVVILLIVIVVLLLAGSLIGLAFSLFWLALTGLLIGALGRLVLPGRQDISVFATALVGIAASLLGGILADVFDVGSIIQFIVAVALAAIGITVFASSEHRRRAA